MTIIKKFEPEAKNNKFPRKYLWLTSIGFFILVLIEIWASNSVISYGGQFENLSSLEKSLKMENQILENEIAKKSSLLTIASKSAELGFSKLQVIEYIP